MILCSDKQKCALKNSTTCWTKWFILNSRMTSKEKFHKIACAPVQILTWNDQQKQTRVYDCLKNNLDGVNSEVLVVAVLRFAVAFAFAFAFCVWVCSCEIFARKFLYECGFRILGWEGTYVAISYKKRQLILTFSTHRQIPLNRVLYTSWRVRFEGSSVGRKPFLWKITSSRVADLSRLRSKALYCKHETANRITCNKVAALRKTRSIFAFCLSTIESQTIS